ncbi:DUF2341 domain-containing protein [Dyella sp. BiH032]|uniref:DUF2341 domain-containing protein n=1 Tax=Dyella sp. BiH032 TaxID=3075430 RepID=UPI0028929EEE|nr:DUF2341 domain-containing protein [Dyella sp. BiH032]WNL44461.1 DUF2341 domain-containing protein [Dyella sp. BiH032]
MRYLILAWLLCLACLPRLAHAAEAAWWNDDWAYRKPITLDTSGTGALLPQSPGRAAVLVRLHPGNFQFDGTAKDGADLRFIAADGKTPLNYQIDSFDPVMGVGQVWVDVTELPANGKQTLWMYYGNAKATAQSSGAATFDADHTLVYHFEEAAAGAPKDATAYANHAQSGSVQPVDGGIVGKAARFDGNTVLTLPSSASLNEAAGGAFTFSAWIKLDAVPATPTALYARRQDGRALVIGLNGGAPYVEVSDGHAPQRSAAGEPLKAGQWSLLAVTFDAQQATVYVNGQKYATLATAMPALGTAATLGGDAAGQGEGLANFLGLMDEVRLSRVARSPVALGLDALSQGAESRLVQYGEDEKKSGAGFGYFGIIVKSVTMDAWVVIAILLVMAAISWVVMWRKGRYVSGVTAANERFLARFRDLGTDLLGLGENARDLRDSSLYRLYEIGKKEVWRRKDAKGRLVIATESIEAIRAVMDSTLVRENQKLARSMVMLTIAISGGPFLGLLGTVVGVMITFAAIAAAGDVNVNAIAPGIAAALLATVAGLFVAIPALFGYNYLLTRNKAVTANMQVFVDEFVTRLAELHRDADAGAAA